MEENFTAFPEMESIIKNKINNNQLDIKSLTRLIKPCQMKCKGMCCYDGIYVDEETAEVIQNLAISEKDFFASLGLQLPSEVFEWANWMEITNGLKTKTRSHTFNIDNYPRHFDNTCCVFMLDNGACSLQMLSIKKGKHPWYYKPIGCWSYPLTTAKEPSITLFNEETDIMVAEDYPGFTTFTNCGRTDNSGTPAYRVLQEELKFLGLISGRDLIHEIDEHIGSIEKL